MSKRIYPERDGDELKWTITVSGPDRMFADNPELEEWADGVAEILRATYDDTSITAIACALLRLVDSE